MPATITFNEAATEVVLENRRSLAKILSPLDKIAGYSPNLVVRRTSQFKITGERYELPSYVFIGPKGDQPPVRLALFAGLHGDEVEGTLALLFLVQLLEGVPELARGYCLFLYPICNPTGYEDGTFLSRQGYDLNQEFWKNSRTPEVRVLEGEIKSQGFDGIITLHSNQSDNFFFGVSRQPLTNQQLVKPALRAVDQFSTQSAFRPVINAQNHYSRNQQGTLSLPPSDEGKAFEIILETANAEAAWLLAALLSILEEHKKSNALVRKS